MPRNYLLLAILLVLVACSTSNALPDTSEPTTTATPTTGGHPNPTPILSLLATPTTTPFPAEGFQTICLEISVESEIQLNHGANDIQEAIENILGGMNLQVVRPHGDCQATLSIEVALASSSDEYQDDRTGGWVTCFTGQSAHGQIVFQILGNEQFTYPIDKEWGPTQGSIYSCPAEDSVYFAFSWGHDLLQALRELWGYSALLSAIQHGSVGGMPYLTTEAGSILEAEGSDAFEIVPDLIDLLSIVHHSMIKGDVVSDALEAITGQDFNKDVEAWRTWWQDQQ
jgi:hypothetical protein